jgi:hypothetical protein
MVAQEAAMTEAREADSTEVREADTITTEAAPEVVLITEAPADPAEVIIMEDQAGMITMADQAEAITTVVDTITMAAEEADKEVSPF